MKIGISSELAGYPHIHLLNGYSLPKDKNVVFKYMPLDRFIHTVDKGELVFVSPETWYDPFEQLYYGIDCSSKGYNTEEIACMCVSEKSSTNEDASWRVYADSSNKTVRISIKRDVLFDLLNTYAARIGCTVYIGKVEYKYEKKEIRAIHKMSSPFYTLYFPNRMKREHYLSLMLLKRKAFSYENEVRIFLVKDSIPFDGNRIITIPCDYRATGLVSNVMLSPYPPIREKGDIAHKVRQKINDTESNAIKEVLYDKLGCTIQQSLLYKVYQRVDRI